MTYVDIDKKILRYLKKKPEGVIIQNLVDVLDYHRFTIQKRLLRLMVDGLIEEVVYTQNCKVYRLSKVKTK